MSRDLYDFRCAAGFVLSMFGMLGYCAGAQAHLLGYRPGWLVLAMVACALALPLGVVSCIVGDRPRVKQKGSDDGE
jgi:hypothetical protein